MPYELITVAARPDPNDRPGKAQRRAPVISTLVLSGTLDASASDAILETAARIGDDGADCVVVEFGDVRVDEPGVLDAFVDGIMALRGEGAQVQVFAREDALHARMSAMPASRDWLLWRASDGSALPRRSLHVDGSTESAPNE